MLWYGDFDGQDRQSASFATKTLASYQALHVLPPAAVVVYGATGPLRSFVRNIGNVAGDLSKPSPVFTGVNL